ncbi:MAG: 3-deoxy-D-manno-octulosonic acid transferase [Phenylobacterium sp.]|uniref:3-deoxy-D-manno-octulosonic acid transferase n=1 Tax=Phenylobacterium sp. TaxID=1871053 RepID=UPI002734BA92|nr:3-deoxy-D-manno-octulosonic acid transferase [Phenylobacterium sp.]MDP1643203.1 3-deoxy-D-manno-octulosonic acid transferase [Phenylobacterium sp.]MDP3116735.1 3-deoxy-D-manno-octulosonic acid transferase [Phenylobacterium sp.]
MKPAPRSPGLAAYRLALAALEPLAPALLQARARRGKEDAERLDERLGRPQALRPPGELVWLHGVSVGESVSLLPLAEALKSRRPDLTLLVTSGTRTAAELLARRLPEGVIHQYAPVDGPRSVAGFLDHWRPATAVLVESELWPNLITAAAERDVRLALVSARMTQKSADGWARAPAAARALLGRFDLILPQDAATAERLQRLGGVTGPQLNLKQVGEPLPCDEDELNRLRGLTAGRPVILAASTHPGEEALIAEAVHKLREHQPGLLLIIAPRHPERGGAVAELLTEAGFNTTRRSDGEAPGPLTTAYVADTLGELGLFFRLADVVVMGGGYAPGVGGHNPLEPARLGATILTGPSVFNAQATYQAMFEEVAALCAPDGAALTRHLRGLLDNPAIARRMGEAALAHAAQYGAALEAALAQLAPLLPPQEAP